MVSQRTWWLVLAMSMFASGASAQVKAGQLKLSLDTGLVSYEKFTQEEGGSKYSESLLTFGPARLEGGTVPTFVNFTAGYAAHEHVIPQLTFSFGVSKQSSKFEYESGESDSNEGLRTGIIVLQPRVEVPFNPDAKVVWGALAGFDFRRIKISDEEDSAFEEESDDVKVFGFGPVGGIVAHVFLTDSISLDLTALVQFDKYKVKDAAYPPDKQNQLNVGLNIGLSGWL